MYIRLLTALLAAQSFVLIAGPDPVLEWNRLMLDAVRHDNTGPTVSTRNLAILNTAIYDAVNSISKTHQPYRFEWAAPNGASIEATATAAAQTVFGALYPHWSGPAEALYVEFVNRVPWSVSVANGLELGRQVAALALTSRQDDRSNTQVPYIPSDEPGQWRRTPPNFRPPLTPHWRAVTGFGIPEVEPFVPPPPPALDSVEYAESFEEVKQIGGKQSAMRTPEQTEIAVFWSDFSYTAMPPGHWHLIAADLCESRGESLLDSARLFALLSIAEADAAIVCWEAKFRYNFWRPITAIQRADEDENPLTQADPSWEDLLPAPPFPAYPSGHSMFSNAAAMILTHFFGTDSISFSATSDSLPGVRRDFNSFSACADEVGRSRIYGGFHFSFDDDAGQWSGAKIGNFIALNYLLPKQILPLIRSQWDREQGLALRIHGQSGLTLVVEQSTDLDNWAQVSTFTSGVVPYVFRPETHHNPLAFFRVRAP